MKIPITEMQARAIGEVVYLSGKRAPLTKGRRELALSDWVSSERPQGEGEASKWKVDGIRLYLVLNTLGGGRGGSFPACFLCLDNEWLAPDKATVKVWVRSGLLEASSGADGIVTGFILTEAGLEKLQEG
jgi:hypothetical protein